MNEVPPIRELKSMCKSISKDPLIALLYRRVSIYITWLVLHTNMTANHVTVLEVIVHSGGSAFFLFEDPLCWGLGFLVIQLAVILDCTDGEVARYRKTFTHRAEFYAHIIKDIFLHSFATLGLFFIFDNIVILVLGVSIILCRSYLFITLPRALIQMNRKKKSFLAKVVTEIGGFYQFLVVPIILDAVFNLAYFRLSYIVVTIMIYFPMACRIYAFQRSRRKNE